jgi:predicted ATPase/DNA-binding SARP family transcriptional activator
LSVVVRILGPLEVEVDGTTVPVRGAKRRGMLALLAARASTPTSPDAICEAIWPDQPLEAARRSVQTYVSQFRGLFGVVTHAAGYQLDRDTVNVDAYRFEQLVASVVPAGADSSSRQLEDALALWRGPALVEFADQEWAGPLATRWEELRRHAEDLWFAAQRAAGFGEEIIPRLEAACAAEPLRESRWEQLILALADAGRPAEALRAYSRIRTTLRDEMGVSPSRSLQDLQLTLLRQDDVPAATVSERRGDANRSQAGLAHGEGFSQVRALMLSDIEGSTRLVQILGRDYVSVLERHHRIIRGVVAGHGGVEEGTEGDSFFVTFGSAADAIQAAVAMQRAFSSESFPRETVVRVRIGIHLGEVTDSEAGLVGTAVHHAARVAAVGHGGQIVVTDLARRMADAGDGVGFVALGEHVVRDVGRIFLHQVVAEGLTSTFPPLRTASVSRASVPAPLSSLIGRDREVREVVDRLRVHRLVTLSGAGGCGKTRMAMAVAATISDVSDVWYVELVDVVDGSQVVATIATTVGVDPSIDAVAGLVGDRCVLLVVDNCEHLLRDAGTVIGTLLQRCARLVVLATSREPLAVVGESVYRVPSLQVPLPGSPLDEILLSDAVRLFEDRAALVRPGYRVSESDAAAVQSICEHLDGIPLALELAAARAAVMTPAEIEARLGDRFRLLTGRTGTALGRQQLLQATVEWSHRLLTPAEQEHFALLAVFPSGFTIDGAVAVAGDASDEYETVDAITALRDKSLLDMVPSPHGTRFRFPETIRQYARGIFLDRDDVDTVRMRHAHHFHTLGARLFQGPRPGEFDQWLAQWTLNADSFMAAADWLAERDPRRAVELLWAMYFVDATAVTHIAGFDRPFEHTAGHPDLAGTAEQCWARALAHEFREELAPALSCVRSGLQLITDDTPPVIEIHLHELRGYLTSALSGRAVTVEDADDVGRFRPVEVSPLFGFSVQEELAFRMPIDQARTRLNKLRDQERIVFDEPYALVCEAVLAVAESYSGPERLLDRARALTTRLQSWHAAWAWTVGLTMIEAEWGDPQRALAICREYVRAARAGQRGPTAMTVAPLLGIAAHVYRIGNATDTATELADGVLRVYPPEEYSALVSHALAVATRSALHRGAGEAHLAAVLLARTTLQPTSFNDSYARLCDEAALVAHQLGDPVGAAQLAATGTAERRANGHRRSPWQQRQIETIPTEAEPLDVEQVATVLRTMAVQE